MSGRSGCSLRTRTIPVLRTHKLTGELSGLWSFSVDYDCRVVFRFSGVERAVFEDIGSPDEVY